MSVSPNNRIGRCLRAPADPTGFSGLSTSSPSSPAIPSSEEAAARDARERRLDDTLAESFPASDTLPWTLGRHSTTPPER